MKNLILAGAAAMTVAALPATAHAQSATHDHGAMTTQQMGMYESWPPDRQAEYDRWPEDQRTYFWTLTPEQQVGWWALTDDQRATVYEMTPQQRVQAWSGISQQMRDRGMASASPSPAAGNTRWVSNPVVQRIAADQAVYNGGEVPICDENEYDNCMNAWEAGLRGPNVTRPLGYWPGYTADRPAGE